MLCLRKTRTQCKNMLLTTGPLSFRKISESSLERYASINWGRCARFSQEIHVGPNFRAKRLDETTEELSGEQEFGTLLSPEAPDQSVKSSLSMKPMRSPTTVRTDRFHFNQITLNINGFFRVWSSRRGEFLKLLQLCNALVLVKSHLHSEDVLPDLTAFVKNRDGHRGSGILIILKQSFKVRVHPVPLKELFVLIVLHPTVATDLGVISVYYPPAESALCGDSNDLFYTLFKTTDDLTTKNVPFLLTGDFNARTGGIKLLELMVN